MVQMQRQFNNLTDNTNKYKSIKMYIFTYNQLTLQQGSIFFTSSLGSLHQTSIHKKQINFQTD